MRTWLNAPTLVANSTCTALASSAPWRWLYLPRPIVGVYAPTLLQLWLGEVPASAARITTLLSVVLVLQVPGYVAAGVLLGAERATELLRITVAAALVNVLASIVLTLTVGVTGPALGSLTAVVLFDVLYLPLKITRMLGADVSALWRAVFKPLLLPAALLFLMLAVSRAAAVSGGPSVLAVSALAGLTFAATVLLSEPGRSLLLRLRKQPL